MWFIPLDCSFEAAKITAELTKFIHAATFLRPDVFSQVSDVITAAITSNTPYEDLKIAIITNFRSCIELRCKELMSKELGNKKPTHLLHRIKKFLGDKYNVFDADLFN